MIYDVTVPIRTGMPVWPSDPPLKLSTQTKLSRDKSHTVRVTSIEMGSHTGTHIDAPSHFVESGRTLSDIPLEWLVGPAAVFEFPGRSSIGLEDVAGISLNGVERILFKTDNSAHWYDPAFYEGFVYLEPEAASNLAERGVRLVGIDYLSIDRYRSESHPTHFELLPNNIVILEGLDLSRIPAGQYHMVALPLKLEGADGAPTRVILIDDK